MFSDNFKSYLVYFLIIVVFLIHVILIASNSIGASYPMFDVNQWWHVVGLVISVMCIIGFIALKYLETPIAPMWQESNLYNNPTTNRNYQRQQNNPKRKSPSSSLLGGEQFNGSYYSAEDVASSAL